MHDQDQQHPADGAEHSPRPLPYDSDLLAALLSVFAQWGSGGFISAMSRRSGQSLDPTTVVAMTALARWGSMRPSKIAEHLHVGASAVSKITNRLTTLGLAERIADPEDARANLLRLTPDGEAVIASLVAAGDGMMAQILADWSDTDRSVLSELLQRFERDVTRHASRTIHNRTIEEQE